MSWPISDKSKSIIKLVEYFELSVYGDEMESWSPKTTLDKNLIIYRVNKIMDELGYSSYISIPLYKKIKIISHTLGIPLCEDIESEESEEEIDILNESNDK